MEIHLVGKSGNECRMQGASVALAGIKSVIPATPTGLRLKKEIFGE